MFRPENDFDRAFRAHYRHLRGRPSVVHVATQMFRGHDVIGPAERLAGDKRHFRHGRLGVGEQKLRAVLDEAAILLSCARQETRDVHALSRWVC